MKKLSHWGAAHPGMTRWIIAVAHTGLTIGAFLFGKYLYFEDFSPTPRLTLLLSLIFMLAFYLYPKRRAKSGIFRHSYRRQKAHDLVLVCTYLAVISLGYHNFLSEPQSVSAAPLLLRSAGLNQAPAPPSTLGEQAGFGLKGKLLQWRKNIRKAAKKSKAEWRQKKEVGARWWQISFKILMTILLLGLTFIGIYYVGALSCGLYCAGYEGWAWVVGLGGGGLVFTAFVFFLVSVWKKED